MYQYMKLHDGMMCLYNDKRMKNKTRRRFETTFNHNFLRVLEKRTIRFKSKRNYL